MVSIRTQLSLTREKTIPEFENSSKKRKLEEPDVEEISHQPAKDKTFKSIFNTELHLETPSPLDWQRRLDIKSGQIHYYNMKTHNRTSKNPRSSPESPSPCQMSLDLELNIPCGSVKKNHVGNTSINNNSGSSLKINSGDDEFLNSSKNGITKNLGGLRRIPSWLAFEGGDEKEMVTAVCKRCHMLVMMCKSSPSCPNCKFMHPPDQSPPSLF